MNIERKQKRWKRRGNGSRLPTVREEVLSENPEAILLAEAFDPALIGIVYPFYVHQPDVSVAAYDRQKIYDILWERMRNEYPQEDDDTVTTYCNEEYWRGLDFDCGEKRRKHLPVLVDRGWTNQRLRP